MTRTRRNSTEAQSSIRENGHVADDPAALRAKVDALRARAERAEEELRRSEERSSAALRGARVALLEMDRDLRYTWVRNPHPDFRDAEFIGRRAEDFYPPDQVERLNAIRRDVLASGTGRRDEVALTIAGRLVVYDLVTESVRDAGGQITGVRSAAVDVTDRRRMEDEIGAVNARFDLALQDSAITIYTLDTDLRYTWVFNPHPLLVAEDVSGNLAGDSPIGPDIRALTDLKRRVLETGVGAIEDVLVVVEGTPLFLDVRIEPLRDAEGRVIGVIGASIDVTEAHRIEVALRESEARFRMLAENAQDLVFRCRISPSFGYEYVSPSVERITGYAPEEFYANPRIHETIIHPDDRAAFHLALTSTDSAVAPFAVRLIRKDGSTIWIEQRSTPILDADGRVVAIEGIARDVTERKRTEEEARRSIERTDAALRSAGITLAEMDRDLRYTWIWNVPREVGNPQIIGKCVEDRVPADEAARLNAIRRDVLATGTGRRDELYITTAGRLVPYEYVTEPVRDAGGAVVGVRFAAIDITARKRMEEEIRLSEQRFRAAVDVTKLTLATFDRDLRYTWVYTREKADVEYAKSLIGQPGESALTPEMAELLMPIRRRVLETGIGSRVEFTASVNGAPLTREIATEPLRDASGEIVGIITTHVDITERKRMEDALRQNEERFRVAIDATGLALTTLDRDLRFTWAYGASPEFTALKGSVIGKSAEDYMHPDRKEPLAAILRRVLETGIGARDELPAMIDGERRTEEFTIESLRDASGETVGLICAAIDITERKRMEDDLARLKEEAERQARELRTIMDLMPAGVMVTNDPECRTMRVNPMGARILGLTTADNASLGAPDAEKPGYRVFRDGREPSPDELPMQVAARGTPLHDVEYEVVRPDGTRGFIRVSATPLVDEADRSIGAVGTLLDITELKRVEAELRTSEERFRLALDAAPVSIFGQDRDLRYRWLYTPRQTRSSDEFLGRTDEDMYAAEDAAVLTMLKRRVIETGAGMREVVTVSLDGGLRTWDLTLEPHRDAGGTIVGVLGAAVEITEQKRIADALRASEERFRVAIAGSRITVFTLDRDLRFTWVHNAIRFVPENVLGRPFAEVIPADDMDYLIELGRRVLAEGTEEHFEMTVRARNETLIYDVAIEPHVASSGEIVGIVGAAVDVTAHRRIERILEEQSAALRIAHADQERTIGRLEELTAALAESEERFRTAFDSAPIGIALVSPRGRHLRVNPAFCAITGYSPEDFTAAERVWLVHPDDRAAASASIDRLLKDEADAYENERRFVRKDGTVIWVLVSAALIRDIDGNPLQFVTQVQDITGRRETQARIEELNDDLRRRLTELRNVNGELEAFSYSVSHDLRAPLRRIEGFGQILLEDNGERLDEEGRHCLGRMLASTTQMLRLIDDLLQLSRVARVELRPQRVNISSLATSILDELRAQRPERRAAVSVAPELAVEGDPNLLRIALANLLGNAWKFTRDREVAEISVGALAGESPRVFFVRDNGAGFDMKNANRLFGAFQRLHTEQEFEGTGVGLATVRRIIHHYGGEIWADAAAGKGATFYFTIGDVPRRETGA